jgi:hypothetical protein
MKNATLCTRSARLLVLLALLLGLTAVGTAAAQDDFFGSAIAAPAKPPAPPPLTEAETADGLSQSPPLVKNASTGLSFVGSVSASYSGSTVRLRADRVVNSRSSGTSGTLRMVLWATTSVPIFGNTISAYTLGSYTLGTLSAGFEFQNIDQTVSFTPPPTGCYYLTMSLQEFDSGTYFYVDLVTFTVGGTPDGSGYNRFAFGGATCPGVTNCVPDSTTACLLNNRFRATVRVRGAFDNLPADKTAFRKPVTGFSNPSFETVFFYFNSADNIEILLKMLDQGNTDAQGHPTIAVLFGSATPLRTELTITDTTNGATRTYISPFASQAGLSDFTAFIK